MERLLCRVHVCGECRRPDRPFKVTYVINLEAQLSVLLVVLVGGVCELTIRLHHHRMQHDQLEQSRRQLQQ